MGKKRKRIGHWSLVSLKWLKLEIYCNASDRNFSKEFKGIKLYTNKTLHNIFFYHFDVGPFWLTLTPVIAESTRERKTLQRKCIWNIKKKNYQKLELNSKFSLRN
jgi:hypothetical protein